MLRNTRDSYGSVSKFFHWLISTTVILMLISGYTQINIDNKPIMMFLFTWHKTIGVLLIFLVVIRLLWRLVNITPATDHIPKWQQIAAKFAHFSLYFVMLAMPLSGWVMSTASGHIPRLFGHIAFPMPGIPASKALAERAEYLHYVLAITFIALISLHLLATLRHHFILKDNVLRRMLPSCK